MARPKNPELEEQRRQQVAAAAFGLLAKHSHDSVTLDDVAREAGISKGLVAYYFKTKDAMFLEAIDRYHALQRQMLHFALQMPSESKRARAELLFDCGFPSRESVEQEVRFQSEVWSFAKSRSDVWEKIGTAYRNFRRECADLLGSQGETVDPMTYLMIHALVDGLSFQVALDPTIDLARLREQFVDLTLSLTQRSSKKRAKRALAAPPARKRRRVAK